MTMDPGLTPPAFFHVGLISICCNSKISSIFTSTRWLNVHNTAGPSGPSPRSTILLCGYLPRRGKNPGLQRLCNQNGPGYFPSANPNKKPTIPTSRIHMDNQLPEALPVHMPNLSPASVGFNWCPPSDVRTNCHQCARRCKSRGPPWQHRPALPPPAPAMGCAAAFGLLKRTIKLRLGPRIFHGRAR